MVFLISLHQEHLRSLFTSSLADYVDLFRNNELGTANGQGVRFAGLKVQLCLNTGGIALRPTRKVIESSLLKVIASMRRVVHDLPRADNTPLDEPAFLAPCIFDEEDLQPARAHLSRVLEEQIAGPDRILAECVGRYSSLIDRSKEAEVEELLADDTKTFTDFAAMANSLKEIITDIMFERPTNIPCGMFMVSLKQFHRDLAARAEKLVRRLIERTSPCKRAVMSFGWVFFLISLGSPHVRRTPHGCVTHRTYGEPNEIELTAIELHLHGSLRHAGRLGGGGQAAQQRV